MRETSGTGEIQGPADDGWSARFAGIGGSATRPARGVLSGGALNGLSSFVNDGYQSACPKSDALYAWAVRPGDIGEVPFTDADGYGFADAIDNCTLVANPTQVDSDAEGSAMPATVT